jgi:hypothetical protein
MNQFDDIHRAASKLSETVQEAKDKVKTDAQRTALLFALRMERGSKAAALLIVEGCSAEALATFRLVLEHLFNVGALLNKEEHLKVLREHSAGEPARQIRKIFEANKESGVLTPENESRAAEFLNDHARQDDPKTGLNWEQIANASEARELYSTYRRYSFLFAHSTMVSLIDDLAKDEVQKLPAILGTALEFARLMIRVNIINKQ